MRRRLLTCLLAIVVLMVMLPTGAFAQVVSHEITAFGNEFEISTADDWATGDLDDGKLVIDTSAGGGAIKLADGCEEATYTSADIDIGAFEYLVMSWNVDAPEGTWVEVTASVWLDRAEHTGWSNYVTWGRWGPFIQRASHASYNQTDSPYINISMDELTVRGNPVNGDTASKVKVQVILHRDNAAPSPVLWYLHGTVRTTGVNPTKVFRDSLGDITDYTCEVEVPQYSQMVRSPNIGGVICSPTTATMLLNSVSEMGGHPLNLLPEEVAMGCCDFRGNFFGNWSYTMAAAGSYGYRSYVDYSTIEGIKRHLKSGYAVGASVAYSTNPADSNYLENAYGSTPGHLIVLRGFTTIGGVDYFISNDAYNPTNNTVRKLYKVDQFENVWSRNTIYVVKPNKVDGVGNHPVQRISADLDEVEVGKYALKLDVFGVNTGVTAPQANSTYSSRHGFIGYTTAPEVFTGENTSTYSYINVASNNADLLTLPDEVVDSPDFKLYLANNDAHTGKLYIVDGSSDIRYQVLATVTSTDYIVSAGDISPNEEGILFGITTVAEFLANVTPARGATVKLFASGTVVEDPADFADEIAKTDGTLSGGDFLAVLAWDNVTLHKYTITEGVALLPLNLSFAQDNVGLYVSDFPFTNALIGLEDDCEGDISYTSSNTMVARVNEDTGQVTPWNVGNNVIITITVTSDGVYQSGSASYTLSVLRGTVSGFHWGTITHPKVEEAPNATYTPSAGDQLDLFFFGTNEPRFTWTGELEDGKFKAGVAYSVSVRLQTFDFPGTNSAYYYANPFTADMITGLPEEGDSTGSGTGIAGAMVTRTSNYQLTVKLDYYPLMLKWIEGYYSDEACTQPLGTAITVSNGTTGASALSRLPSTGYAKVSDGSVVAVDITWAFDNTYSPSSAGTYPLTAAIVAHEGTGLEDTYISPLVGTVTVRRAESPSDPPAPQPVIGVGTSLNQDRASAQVSDAQVTSALAAARRIAGEDGPVEVTVNTLTPAGVNAVSVNLSGSAIATLAAESRATLTIRTGVASVTLSHDVLAQLAAQVGSDEQISIVMEVVNPEEEGLSDEVLDLIGTSIVRRIALVFGNTEAGGVSGAVQIFIPYTPSAGEDVQNLTILTLGSSGVLREVENAQYDAERGGFTGASNGLSLFFVSKDAVKLVTDYADVEKVDWYYPGVRYVTETGVMLGTAKDHFEPTAEMSRSMLVTTLYRYAGSPDVEAISNFTDVLDGEWYANAVIWAEANGMVGGYGDGTFGASDQVTRQQFVTILYRFATSQGRDVSAGADLAIYTDADGIEEWAGAAMKWAVAEGIIEGRTTTTLAPEGFVTRAEAATMLMRYAALNH